MNAYSERISLGPDINNLTGTRILKIIKRGKVSSYVSCLLINVILYLC